MTLSAQVHLLNMSLRIATSLLLLEYRLYSASSSLQILMFCQQKITYRNIITRVDRLLSDSMLPA
jgi:hypothetical protein